MSILFSHAVLVNAFLEPRVKPETVSEVEHFVAMGVELERQARHQRIVRLKAAVTTFLMGVLGRPQKVDRDEHADRNMQKGRKTMPTSLLHDFVVTRD